MHEVEAPERRPFVTHPMPPPERVVEKNNRRQRVRHRRESKAPQQTEALSECRLAERPLHDRLDQRGQCSECEIATETPLPRLNTSAKRPFCLGPGDRCECAECKSWSDPLTRFFLHSSFCILHSRYGPQNRVGGARNVLLARCPVRHGDAHGGHSMPRGSRHPARSF